MYFSLISATDSLVNQPKWAQHNNRLFLRVVSIVVELPFVTGRYMAYNLTLWPLLYKYTVNKCVYESYDSTVTSLTQILNRSELKPYQSQFQSKSFNMF